MITIELPWPDKRLNPNVKLNRFRKAEATAEARAFSGYLTRESKVSTIEWYSSGLPYKIVASYTFYPPDRRHRDIDNCLAMMKPYQDGVCAALGVDDSSIKRTVLEWGDVTPGGKVVLTLEEME